MTRQKSTHVDDPRAVGERLSHARKRAGLSQRQLAFQGCSPAYISRIEAGERIPSLQLLRELGKRLGVSEDYLARGEATSAEPPSTARELEAELALRLDDIEAAETLYGELLNRATSDREKAGALGGLGQIAFRRGDPVAAKERLEEALALIGPDDLLPASLADTLGRAYAQLAELEEAIALFERSLEFAEAREDIVDTIRFSVLLANALIDSGNLSRAEVLLGHTIARSQDLGDPLVRARVYWSQSRLHAFKEQPDIAARYARKALETIERTEDTRYIARAHELLAHIELDRGASEEGLRLVRRSLDLLGSEGTPLEFHKFRLDEARALAQLGHIEEAASIAMESAGALLAIQPLEAARGYGLIADAFKALGETARALELYELAAEAHEATPNRYLSAIYSNLADLLEQEGRKDEAFEFLKKAVKIQAGMRETR